MTLGTTKIIFWTEQHDLFSFKNNPMDETEECVICHQPNEQMLMLTCVHDPCINCAVEHYSKESNGKVRYNV